MTAVVDGVVDIVDYDVYATEAPEEDEYIVARALADFVPEEEGRFIALEINAPVFIFTKHASGWWTGECKGKYGLFPSNFVTEEFQVTLRPKASDSNVVGGENDPGAIPVIAGGAETSSEDSDDDTDSDEEIDEMDEDDEDENNPNGSPPISIPNSAHATPEKSIPVPILSLPPSDSSFLLNDPSKLTPVSRQLGEFVDRLNESARTPPTSNPTTPTHASNSPRFATPQNPAQRKGAGSGLRVTRTDSVGSEDMLYDPEQSKLTPVSRQLGEFVERLNQGRPASVNMTSTSAGKGKGRNGEPIFNVFDGLLADIESLRNTGAAEGEWDDVDGVYNTPEAARARIAIDVQALREELEQHKSARMSAESDIVRLREEFSAQLEVERKGRQILEKKLSERDPLLIEIVVKPSTNPTLSVRESKSTETEPDANPLQKELDESRAQNRMLEKELEKLHQAVVELQREGEEAVKRSTEERNQIVQELEHQKSVNKQLETELAKMTEEVRTLKDQNIQTPGGDNDELQTLRDELQSLRIQKEELELQSAEHIRTVKEQLAHQKEEEFLIEREQLIQHRDALMHVELQKLSERDEQRTQYALDGMNKQLAAVIAAHEETRKRLELERDQAREGEAAKAKEIEEMKVKYQKLKSLPPMPKPAEPKTAKSGAGPPRLSQSQNLPPQESQAPRRLSHPETSSSGLTSTNEEVLTVSDDNAPPPSQLQRVATAPRLGHSSPALQSDQPKQPPVSLRGSQPAISRPDSFGESEQQQNNEAQVPPKPIPRAVSHDAVPSTHSLPTRPPRAITPTPLSAESSTKSPNITREESQGPDGQRRLAVAGPVRRTIANRPPEDNSLENNALFQQRRLSTQGLLDPPSSQPQQTTTATTQPQTPQQQANNPVLRRAASSLPSVPSSKE